MMLAGAADVEAGADAPGAVQLSLLKKIFMDRKVVASRSGSVNFASGGNTNGKVLNLAARHKDGQWVMAYLASKAFFPSI
jgi:hypothetical protein